MGALPTQTVNSQGFNTRGNGSTITIGTSYDNSTLRIDYERMLHAILKDLRFYRPKDYLQASIPAKQNELIHFDINQRATGAVYQLDEFGRQLAGVNNSLGVAQTGGADPVGLTLNMTFKEAKPKRYGSVMFYTAIARSVSKRDIVAWGEAEMGIIVAEQHDNLVKGIYDSAAQDLYPRTEITADNDADWSANDVFDYNFVLRVEAYMDAQGWVPPESMGEEFPVLCPLDFLTSLLTSNTTQTILRETLERNGKLGGVFAKGYLGSLRNLAFFKTNRISATTVGSTGQYTAYRAYICTREALGCVAMESEEYGRQANDSVNNAQAQGTRGWNEDEMPRPVQVIRHEPGAGTLGQDLFKDKGALAEKHTVGFEILRAGGLIRLTAVAGTGSNYGVGRAGTGGSF